MKPTARGSVAMGMSDDAAPDFLQHLESRLGVDPEAAFAILKEWLAGYEPIAPREIEFSSKRVPSAPELEPVSLVQRVA